MRLLTSVSVADGSVVTCTGSLSGSVFVVSVVGVGGAAVLASIGDGVSQMNMQHCFLPGLTSRLHWRGVIPHSSVTHCPVTPPFVHMQDSQISRGLNGIPSSISCPCISMHPIGDGIGVPEN